MADTGRKLYQPHAAALMALHGDLENFARAQAEVLTGTPGSVLERSNASGFRYYAHQSYDAHGKKIERYLAGPAGDARADAKAQALREKVQALGEALKHVRLLAREGFKLVDSKAYATLASLHNQSLFKSGAVMVGSHAYGALLNQLGVRAAQYATQDVDIARSAKLAFETRPQLSFLEMLNASGIPFSAVPGLDPRQPATSFKETGRSFFQVDLLVPSANEKIGVVAVPELKAHATSLPFLRYLLGESHDAIVLAREGCCAVRVPSPQRFAWHKLLVSQLRKKGDKALKDAAQAAVLLAVLSERHPGALEEATGALPASARKHVAKAAGPAREALSAHPRAVEALESIASA
ncbi:MAG: GSU2403 family nucleotidyltransferase fold protein [Betaproteobacteria bacterium]